MTLRGWIGTPIVALALLVPPTDLPAQLASTAAAGPQPTEPSARTYDGLFDELIRMRPRADRAAEVSNLVLQRDVGAVHPPERPPPPAERRRRAHRRRGVQGHRRLLLRPLEQDRARPAPAAGKGRLAGVSRSPSCSWCSPTERRTSWRRRSSSGPMPTVDEMRGAIDPGLEFLADEDSRTFDPDFMSAWLNGERSDLFFAYVKRKGRDPVAFSINPNELEGVRLQSRIRRQGYDRHAEVITQFPLKGSVRSGVRRRAAPPGRRSSTTRSTSPSRRPASARSASPRPRRCGSWPTPRWARGSPSSCSRSSRWTRRAGRTGRRRRSHAARRARSSG